MNWELTEDFLDRKDLHESDWLEKSWDDLGKW